MGRNEHPGLDAELGYAGKLSDLESQSNRKQNKFNRTECQVLLSGTGQALLT